MHFVENEEQNMHLRALGIEQETKARAKNGANFTYSDESRPQPVLEMHFAVTKEEYK
jgi:hypothetical protein